MTRTPDTLPAARWAALVLAALLLGPLNPLPAQEAAEIQLFNRAFLPTQVTIDAGGQVTWTLVEGEHVITSGLSSSPDDRPGELFEVVVNEENPVFTFTFDTPGDYPFFDALNEQAGGVGVITVRSFSRTFRVGVVDNAYIPEDIRIFAGDTIHWEHEPMEAFHTVTSGASSAPEDRPGELFDEESSDQKPNFFYTFDDAGFFPYFCRPHEHLDMVGTVLVQELFTRGDFDLDGSLDIGDVIQMLRHQFAGVAVTDCLDAADVNDDGLLALSDPVELLHYLFLGAAAPPAPFPAPGPDRTEDELVCVKVASS